MGQPKVFNKRNAQLLKIAIAQGARIVHGKKHILIYDGQELVCVLGRGHNKDRVPGGNAKIALRAFEKRGWK